LFPFHVFPDSVPAVLKPYPKVADLCVFILASLYPTPYSKYTCRLCLVFGGPCQSTSFCIPYVAVLTAISFCVLLLLLCRTPNVCIGMRSSACSARVVSVCFCPRTFARCSCHRCACRVTSTSFLCYCSTRHQKYVSSISSLPRCAAVFHLFC